MSTPLPLEESGTTSRDGSLYFLERFLRHPSRVSALAPSSRQLAAAMVQGLELGDGDLVVEYGPGTGSFTRVLLPFLRRGARYLGIECDPGFCAVLRRRFPALDFVEGSAENIVRILGERSLPAPRAVLSGMPLGSMPLPVKRRVLGATANVLAPNGQFRTFSYVHCYPTPGGRTLREEIRRHFREFTLSAPVFRNLPPAFVLGGRK